MNILLKLLKVVGIIFVTVAFIACALIYFSGPKLPEDIDKIIDDVMQSELPELIHGDTGYVKSGDTKIWFESILILFIRPHFDSH